MTHNGRLVLLLFRASALLQEKRAMDKNHEDVQRIYTELVDDCTRRPPSDEDANSIAGAWTLPPHFHLELTAIDG